MIDERVFAEAMVQLGGVFAREVDKLTMATYYRVLSPRMTTEAFREAIERVLISATFWPTPAVILRHGDNGVAKAALSEVMRDLDRQHGFRFVSPTWHASLPPATRAAISAVGGLRALSMCSTYDWDAMERRFVEAYFAYLLTADAERAALGAPVSDRELPRAATPGDRHLRVVNGRGDDNNGGAKR